MMVDQEYLDWSAKVSERVRPIVLSALPEPALDLLHQIETFSGVQVQFRDMEMLRLAGGQNTVHEALFCDHERAYISVPDVEFINANAIVHELLHLNRYWVEQVPQVDATHDIGTNVELMSSIDNTLEHLVIVPREREFGFEPSQYWAASTLSAISGPEWRIRSPEWVRGACILSWLSASLTNDEPVRDQVKRHIDRHGHSLEAERALSRVLAQKHSKPRMVRAALKALKLPLKSAQLVTLDIQNKVSRTARVPEL